MDDSAIEKKLQKGAVGGGGKGEQMRLCLIALKPGSDWLFLVGTRSAGIRRKSYIFFSNYLSHAILSQQSDRFNRYAKNILFYKSCTQI